MTLRDTKRAAVGYVVAVVGSLSRAAEHLGTKPGELREWLQGDKDVPKAAFVAAVDFLLAATEARLEAARDIIERSKLPALTPQLERLLEKRRS